MRILYLLLFLGVAFILYLSWQPSYDFKNLWFMPEWLTRWTDKHENGNLRTAVPFFFMGFAGGVIPSSHPRPFYRWAIIWLILVVIVALAEAGQLLIPSRFPSWEDIGWGSLGAFAGMVAGILVYFILRKSNLLNKY
ncbi:VanZ family protein [Spirosoma gilvum]